MSFLLVPASHRGAVDFENIGSTQPRSYVYQGELVEFYAVFSAETFATHRWWGRGNTIASAMGGLNPNKRRKLTNDRRVCDALRAAHLEAELHLSEKSKAEASMRAALRQNSLSSSTATATATRKPRHSDLAGTHAQSSPSTPQAYTGANTPSSASASASAHDRYTVRSLSVPHVQPSPNNATSKQHQQQQPMRHSATHSTLASKLTPAKLTSPKFTTPGAKKMALPASASGAAAPTTAFKTPKTPVARHSLTVARSQSVLNSSSSRTPSLPRASTGKFTPTSRPRSVSSRVQMAPHASSNGVNAAPRTPKRFGQLPRSGKYPAVSPPSVSAASTPTPTPGFPPPQIVRAKSPSLSLSVSRSRSSAASSARGSASAASSGSSGSQSGGDGLNFHDESFATISLSESSTTTPTTAKRPSADVHPHPHSATSTDTSHSPQNPVASSSDGAFPSRPSAYLHGITRHPASTQTSTSKAQAATSREPSATTSADDIKLDFDPSAKDSDASSGGASTGLPSGGRVPVEVIIEKSASGANEVGFTEDGEAVVYSARFIASIPSNLVDCEWQLCVTLYPPGPEHLASNVMIDEDPSSIRALVNASASQSADNGNVLSFSAKPVFLSQHLCVVQPFEVLCSSTICASKSLLTFKISNTSHISADDIESHSDPRQGPAPAASIQSALSRPRSANTTRRASTHKSDFMTELPSAQPFPSEGVGIVISDLTVHFDRTLQCTQLPHAGSNDTRKARGLRHYSSHPNVKINLTTPQPQRHEHFPTSLPSLKHSLKGRRPAPAEEEKSRAFALSHHSSAQGGTPRVSVASVGQRHGAGVTVAATSASSADHEFNRIFDIFFDRASLPVSLGPREVHSFVVVASPKSLVSSLPSGSGSGAATAGNAGATTASDGDVSKKSFDGLFKFSGLLQTPFWLVWRPASSPPGTEIISQHQVVWDRPQASEAIHVSVRCPAPVQVLVPFSCDITVSNHGSQTRRFVLVVLNPEQVGNDRKSSDPSPDLQSSTDHTLEVVDHETSSSSRALSALTKASLRRIGAEISESSLRDASAAANGSATQSRARGHKGTEMDSKGANSELVGVRHVQSPALLCRESIVQLGHKGAEMDSQGAENELGGLRRVQSPALLCRESIVQLGHTGAEMNSKGADNEHVGVRHVQSPALLCRESIVQLGPFVEKSAIQSRARGHQDAEMDSKGANSELGGVRHLLSPALLCRESIVQLGDIDSQSSARASLQFIACETGLLRIDSLFLFDKAWHIWYRLRDTPAVNVVG